MKVVAIVQARMGSSRLPGKVMKPMGDNVVLEFLLKRLARAATLDEVIVATTELADDNQIVDLVGNDTVKVYRGPETDVLQRYKNAADESKADVIVRVTGDCPFVDPELVDDCVNRLIDRDLDYISNCNNALNPLPDGFDVEVFTSSSFVLIDKLSITEAYREHVTFGYFKTGLFTTETINYEHSYSHLRLTLDYEEDYKVISRIADEMGAEDWGWQKISKFVSDNQDIVNINSHIVRNASWEKSFLDENRDRGLALTRPDCIANGSGLLSKRADQFSPEGWPENYLKAKGQVIWSGCERLFLDYSIGGIGATTLGYGCDFVDKRVIHTILNGSACSVNSSEEITATQKLIRAIPWIESARFTRSGGEATTLAVRIARAKTGKTKILFSGYHGWHDWYLAAALNHKLGNHLLEDLPIAGVPKELGGTSIPFDYGDINGFDSYIGEHRANIAAVILEPMRYSSPDIKFLKHVRKECANNNIVLIFDEISSGFRFNNSAVHLDIGINPDLVVFSKAIGNGYPIAVVAGKNEIMLAVKDSFISSTTHTESIGFSAMSAVLDFYEANPVSQDLANRGKAIRNILTESASTYDLAIKTAGMDQLWSWSFEGDLDRNRQLQTIVTEIMLDHSILFSNRFYATLGIDSDFYPLFERALKKSFKAVSSILSNHENPADHIHLGINRLGIY
jgi:glutamate-1-semialdehyde 2,1-aminomutase